MVKPNLKTIENTTTRSDPLFLHLNFCSIEFIWRFGSCGHVHTFINHIKNLFCFRFSRKKQIEISP